MKLQLQNIANLFKNIRTRSIIILTGCILLFGFLYGFLHLSNKKAPVDTSIQLKGSPNIQSIPGGLEQSPSADYQRLQAQQNLEQAALAEKTGSSTIPTLLNSNQFNQLGQGISGSSPCPCQMMNNGCSPCDACAKYRACAGIQSPMAPVSSLQPSQLKSGTLIYDTQGKVIGHLGADGKVRDSNGQIIGQVGPDGLVRSEDGTVIGSAAVPAMGDAVYDVAGRLIGTVGRDGKVRDAQGRVIGTVGPDGIVRNLKGAVIGKVKAPTLLRGAPIYDASGHLLGTVGADGKVRDANGKVIGEVGADGLVRNADGKIIGKTGVKLAGAPVYDASGHLLGTVGADGKVRDANGKVIGEVGADGLVRNADGKIIGKTGANMAGTPVYDASGHLLGTVGADGKVRDANGKVIGEVGADGLVRNADGKIIGKTGANMAGTPVYDASGHLLGTVGADGKVRDANGKVIGEVGADGIVRNADGKIIGKTGVKLAGAPVYDASGHLLGTVGADGKVRDANGKVIGEVGADGLVRNADGKIIGQAYLKGTGGKKQAIPGTPVYDHQGKLIGTLDSNGEVRNAQGKVIGKLDSDGLVRGLHDEIIGELGTTAPGTPVYDKLGHLVGTVGSDGIVRDVQGKALGKLGADGIVRDAQGNPIGSIMPPRRNVTTSLPTNDNNATATNAAVSLIPDATNKPNPELQAILDRQAQQISVQKAEQLQQQMQSSMSTQASQLFAAWTSPSQQYVAGTPDLSRLGAGLDGALSGSFSASAKAPAVKAGTIMYAVLLTAVNSDEPGPVLAEIVQGKFKGARLMGTLSNQGQKVLLSFNTLTLPKLSESVAINTVAIDENTARTALSSDTNNHYWLRYGTLFASAFIQGYGQSFINSAPNYNISLFPPAPDNQPQKNNLSPRDRVFVGLGQVGLQYSSVLKNIFNTPPTVKVFSGTPMGILFLSDLAALPTS